jgi:Uncharacterized protein conserved in bacteria
MTHPPKRDGQETGKTDGSDDANLSKRLATLDARLSNIDTRRKQEEKSQAQPAGDRGAIGQAFRLSAEFVSGVIAGGLAGWLVDQLSGWSPWGLVVGLLLGFCAGMLNLMRAAGMVKTLKLNDKS